MKTEIPTWAVVVVIALVLGLIGAWFYARTSKPTSDVVVEKTFGDESNPFGNQAPPPTASPARRGAGASGP